MMTKRSSAERGLTEMGWLTSRHTFSFGEYYDAEHMGFRTLRVINDDHVRPGQGFGTHGHRDMEIISVVLAGALAHKDDLQNGATLSPGEVQVMCAGSGIRHSEFNPSKSEDAHFLQVWITPDRRNHQPGWEQRAFPAAERTNVLRRVAGPKRTPDDGALLIHQDADVYWSILEAGKSLEHRLASGRGAWVHVATGAVTIGGENLAAGDAIGVEGESAITLIGAAARSEVLVFDLA